MSDEVAPSWEVFYVCLKCGAGEGQPCTSLRTKFRKELENPHPGRRMKKSYGRRRGY